MEFISYFSLLRMKKEIVLFVVVNDQLYKLNFISAYHSSGCGIRFGVVRFLRLRFDIMFR